jgi:uncharacterized RDD family membrane protein YckC
MEPAQPNFTPRIVEELEKAEEAHLKNCPNAEFPIRLASTVVDGVLTYLAVSGLQNSSRALNVFLVGLQNHFATQSGLGSIYSYISNHSNEVTLFLEMSLKILFIYFYYIVSTSLSGGTPGKLLMGLRVLEQHGRKLTHQMALLRFFIAGTSACLSFGLSYFLILFNKDQQAYHDILTRSCVKKVHGVK